VALPSGGAFFVGEGKAPPGEAGLNGDVKWFLMLDVASSESGNLRRFGV
jgi:hypothetical protein